MKRQAEITAELGAPTKLIRFTAHERMGELFTIKAEIVTEERVDMLPSLGKTVKIEVFELEASVRFFHGVLVEAHYIGGEDQGYHYQLALRPWLHLLGHNRAYRIFEDRTAVDIVREVLEDYSRYVDYSRLSGRYLPIPYCTQYRESDLNFVLRLLQREGIYFFFRHEAGAHILVLCDSPAAHQPSSGRDTVKLRADYSGRGGLAEALWAWREHATTGGEAAVVLQSFDYQTTRTRTGRMAGDVRTQADRQQIHEFTGDFVDEALGSHWALVKLQAAQARQRYYTGEGDAIGLACGGRFTLDSDDAFDRGQTFVITALAYDMWAEPYRTGNSEEPRRVEIEAVTADTAFRAPIVTPLPFAGPETAIVMVGGADDSHADPMGRVRVRFLWGDGGPPDKARSCWLRVSHPSAGAGFGHVTLPRNNEEVIVDFLGGNPDRPIVTGRVYNSEHRHAYPLPQNRTRSLYRSHSIGAIGSYPGAESAPSGPGFNEMRFEDKGGSEEIYLRAQRNRLAEVLLDDEARISRDRKTRIGRNRSTAVRGDEATTVETGDYRLNVEMGQARIEAKQSITLQVGMNMLVIDNSGIHLKSGKSAVDLTPINISAEAMMIRSRGEIMTMLTGEAIVIDAQGGVIVGSNGVFTGTLIGPPL
ncbi:type VI secretion system Vgr family protein [Sphingomonas sp. NFR15]|uniref:type VI secretion system Vgr family protein n=1 Tax=Sphingomonas sp. NFR15 TaxID=1566282 RepID=UPI0008835350|nr:type VI secretion system tip protein TssI/VgrG [Sphingomonas sp. NFR15]SDA24739.1 type VI secretion system secreted protein VgrG [Sphingomonas sp. NFR15]